eukprot:7874216-Lingulodinium_polyedra.AAC.1
MPVFSLATAIVGARRAAPPAPGGPIRPPLFGPRGARRPASAVRCGPGPGAARATALLSWWPTGA